MSGLFSHPSSATESAERAALHVEVSVPAPRDHAWAGLTEHLHLWWPAGELSRWGEDSFFDLEDNALVETSSQDDENVWGEMVDGQPGQWLELRWKHVGSTSATQVRMEMAEVVEDALDRPGGDRTAGDGRTDDAPVGTRLTLIHSGWTAADPQDLYEFYTRFWPDTLARYRRFMGGS
ncbi:SRPBCC family protein [Arthrobacter sp. TmT3-37]